MWRLVVVQLYSIFISVEGTAIPSPSSASDIKTQVHGSAQVLEAIRAKHGYRYEVQFPTTQRKSIVPSRYQSVEKDKDNDGSDSIGSATLAKYTNEYESFMDSPALPSSHSQPSKTNNVYSQNEKHVSPSYSRGHEDTKILNEKYANKMNMTDIEQNFYSNTNVNLNPDIYLPPQTFDSPSIVTNRSEGYSYDKPFNQLTLPNEHYNNKYTMTDLQWYPSVTMSAEDDSVEVFPPTELPHTTWMDDNTVNQNYKSQAETQVYTEAFTNNLPPHNPQQPPVAFNRYRYDNYNSKVSLPIKNIGYDDSTNTRPNTLLSFKNSVESDKPIKVITHVNPIEQPKLTETGNHDESKSARISSTGLEAKTDELPKTSLIVHFAGSVFSAEGLPHPSKEMVFPVDYKFSYDLQGWPEMGHEETRTDRTTRGRYWVGLPDGRVQVVEYTAGPQGFMPRVSYRSRDP